MPMKHHTEFDGPRINPNGRGGGRKCSICSLPGDGRAVVEAAFARGLGVRRVHQTVGMALGLSESAIARHRRFHQGLTPLDVGIDTVDTFLDSLGDRARLRRHGVELADRAHANGHTLEYSRAVASIDKLDEGIARDLGIEFDDWDRTIAVVNLWQRSLRRAIHKRIGWGIELADVLDEMNDSDAANQIREMVAVETELQKENATNEQ